MHPVLRNSHSTAEVGKRFSAKSQIVTTLGSAGHVITVQLYNSAVVTVETQT